MKPVSALLCLAAALVSTSCFTGKSAQASTVTPEQSFKAADLDGDGKVSRAEYDSYLIGEMFARYDKDKDSVITEKEFVSNGGTKEGFYKVNTSGTGKITLHEARSSAAVKKTLAAPFKEADTNGDGQVTLAEFRISREKTLDYVR
ncbi:EF-hand domain-containing protein [Luteolibacter flavescens]|uniref:EF-hand domain-containing protein n=1 Tax=Luteolibacter flavescens TaxID=1859460 RepID=A0ABT3FU41_9BACT|nr:EF-hand domain-containing protein [Luteolibacter flavescens]MCW1887085.1 EF-hand domain-containing protein [Luteolibacter flavescens]